MNTISFRLPDQLLARLEKQSRERRISKSSLIRECLEEALDKKLTRGKFSCYELAADLVGSIEGLPRDLAINPKYMDDFGK